MGEMGEAAAIVRLIVKVPRGNEGKSTFSKFC